MRGNRGNAEWYPEGARALYGWIAHGPPAGPGPRADARGSVPRIGTPSVREWAMSSQASCALAKETFRSDIPKVPARPAILDPEVDLALFTQFLVNIFNNLVNLATCE